MTALSALIEPYKGLTLTSSKALYPEAGGEGLPLIRVRTSLCEAVVSPQGAQLLEFTAAAGTPLLWLSPQCRFEPGKALRGGVPVCLPWFGPHPADPDKPQHGFARTSEWTLTQVAESDDGRCELWFQLVSKANSLFEYDFTAELSLMLGQTAQLELSVTNDAGQAFECTWALHSYFPVNSLAKATVPALAGRAYLDNLEHLTRKTQNGALSFAGEVDRIFPAIDQPLVIEGKPRIHIGHDNCPSVITWNPGVEKAASMADVGAGNEQGFICIERGAVLNEGWRLEPGEKRSGKLIIGE